MGWGLLPRCWYSVKHENCVLTNEVNEACSLVGIVTISSPHTNNG